MALDHAMKMYFNQQLCEKTTAVEMAKLSLIEFAKDIQALPGKGK